MKGLLERGLNSTGVNGDGRAIIKGGGGGGNKIVFGKCAILQTMVWLLRIKKHIRKRALSTALCFTLLYWTITVVDSDLLRLT